MKQDCFANNGRGGCTLLDKKDCSNCNFYKTNEEFEEDRLKALQRIMSLHEKDYILNKYKIKIEGDMFNGN